MRRVSWEAIRADSFQQAGSQRDDRELFQLILGDRDGVVVVEFFRQPSATRPSEGDDRGECGERKRKVFRGLKLRNFVNI